jgi:hypothetical protein
MGTRSTRGAVWRGRSGAAGFVFAAGAVLALVIGAIVLRQQESSAAPQRHSWISIAVKHGSAVKPLGTTLDSGDELLFAYSNLDASRARHLAIAAKDARGRVHWYHPAYRSREEKPESIVIERGVQQRELEPVRAIHPPGTLEICALFTERPLSVSELDRALDEDWPRGAARDCRRVTAR